jgi:hypothetical protein
MLHRRLVRDYGTNQRRSRAMIHWAMIDNMSRRLTSESTSSWRDDLPADPDIVRHERIRCPLMGVGVPGMRILVWIPFSQEVVTRLVLRLAIAGPGCDLPEEAAVGTGPSALDCRVAPGCPPGTVASVRARLASWIIRL